MNLRQPTTQEKIEDILKDLPPEAQLQYLEKLAMKIRKRNSIRINEAQMQTKLKYPKK